jgi:CBS domain-containing protein
VRAESTVADAADAMLAKRAPVALVVADTPARQPLGLVTATALAKLPVRERPGLPVTQLMSRAFLITPEDELADVQRLLDEEGAEAAVVADQGQILGTLAREEIARALQLRQLAAARL